VASGTHALEQGRRWSQTPIPRRVLVVFLALVAIASGGVYYLASVANAPESSAATAAQMRLPAADTSVLTGPPDAIAVGAAHQLFAAAPVVVVAAGGQPGALATAAREAHRRFAPLLLTSAAPTAGARAATRPAHGARGGTRPAHGARGGTKPAAGGTRPTAGATGPAAGGTRPAAVGTGLLSAAARAEIRSLRPSAVLAVGISASALAAQLPGLNVVDSTAKLPATTAPASLRQVALLVRRGSPGAATIAAMATARAAGAQVIAVNASDPRADPAAISTLAATRPNRVMAVGAAFGTASALAANVAVAETGVQLPGGGQVLFPGHRLVALYGNPGTPALGALGQQGLTASIARVSGLAARYRQLSSVPVVPTFEIIATVAQGSAGPNGLYSYESPVASLRPWVQQATAAGLYVLLDLQPGRASLLAQARMYQSLLKLPDVGLALDPEWQLGPGELPLQQIGSVNIAEVNSVIGWLAGLTARYHLPQKLLVLHQFRLSMILGEAGLDTHHADLAIVIHMDGQGSPGDKVQTWDAVTAAAPSGVSFGWKNFLVKDHPMLTPWETMHRAPQPVMISYQ
jgi:hypothetical protein